MVYLVLLDCSFCWLSVTVGGIFTLRYNLHWTENENADAMNAPSEWTVRHLLPYFFVATVLGVFILSTVTTKRRWVFEPALKWTLSPLVNLQPYTSQYFHKPSFCSSYPWRFGCRAYWHCRADVKPLQGLLPAKSSTKRVILVSLRCQVKTTCRFESLFREKEKCRMNVACKHVNNSVGLLVVRRAE